MPNHTEVPLVKPTIAAKQMWLLTLGAVVLEYEPMAFLDPVDTPASHFLMMVASDPSISLVF